jgi:hypothetical protein
MLLTSLLTSRLPPVLRDNEDSRCTPDFSSSLLIGLVTLAVSMWGWQSHTARRYTADELCTLRQSMAFEQSSATLPLSTFDPHLDPTGPCFARSQFGYFSVQAPAWAATLAAAKEIGIPQERVPWLIASFTLLIVGLIGAQLGGALVGAVTIVALSHNQFFDEMSRSYWSHSLTMLLTACGVLLLVRIPRSAKRPLFTYVLGLGLISGAILLTRPLVGLSFMTGAALAISFFMQRPFSKKTLQSIAIFAVGPLLGVILYGYFNLSTTGSFFLSGYEYIHGPGHNPGFFQVAPNGIEHTPARAASLLHHHVRLLLRFTFPSTWPFIAILPVAFTIGWSPQMRTILLVLVSLWLGASTYWDSSFFYGPRFYYESMIPLTLLAINSYATISRALSYAIPCSPRTRHLIGNSVFVIVALLTLPLSPVQ